MDRNDRHSDVWFLTIEEALEGIQGELVAGANSDRLLLTWESNTGTVGLVAEGQALAAWAVGVTSVAEATEPPPAGRVE